MAGLPEAVKDWGEGVRERERTKATLQASLASTEFQQKKLDQDNTYKALTNLSAYMNSLKTDGEREAFVTTDHYKEVSKLVKDNLPEYYDKKSKKITLLNNKEVIETELKGHEAYLAGKIAQGLPLSTADKKLKDFLDKVDVRIASTAIDMAMKDLNWDMADEAGKSRMVQMYVRRLQETRGNIYSDDLGGPGPGTPAPTGEDVNPNTWLLEKGFK